MTAVAAPPSFVQSGSRPAWASGHQGSSMSMTQMTPEEVSRLLMPPRSKSSSRSSSSSASSISSNSSSASNSSASSVASNDSVGSTPSTTPSSSWAKKKTRSAWPGKQDGINNMRSSNLNGVGGGLGTSGGGSILNLSTSNMANGVSAGGAAAAAANGGAPFPILPSQHMIVPSTPSSSSSQNNDSRLTFRQGGSFLMLLPLNGTFERKVIPLPFYPDVLRIGRQTNAKTLPTPSNGFFDSKVLSRQHAEIWAEKGSGRVFLKDIKSSNGTFVNGTRLSPENRESEPHELRAEDILELGIDIVGEDNKTIVHHKVAARVEHAGFHHGGLGGTGPGPFDLNFGDIDPIMGGLMAPPLNHVQTSSNRSRSNSQTSKGSAVSFVNPNIPANHRPGQILSALPITIESLVKKIHFELQQAKQQSMDLKRTSDYLDTVMTKKIPERKSLNLLEKDTDPDISDIVKEKVLMPNGNLQSVNGVEYPDTASEHDMMPGVAAKEKFLTSGIIPRAAPSPKETQPEQIETLVAELVSVRKDLDQRTKQVLELEESLRIEREARESAEERVERLEQSSLLSRDTTISPAMAKFAEKEIVEFKGTPPPPSAEEIQKMVREASERAAAAATAAADTLRNQLQEMVSQLQNSKEEAKLFKQRFQEAENERNEAKTSLRELVEKVKREEEERARQSELLSKNQNGSAVNGSDSFVASKGLANGVGLVGGRGKPEGGVMGHVIGMTTERIFDKDGNKIATFADKGAPYISMLGVVIIGVGLMVVINSWQKGER